MLSKKIKPQGHLKSKRGLIMNLFIKRMNIFKQVMNIFKPAMNIFNSKALPIKGVARFGEQPRQSQGMPGSVAAYG